MSKQHERNIHQLVQSIRSRGAKVDAVAQRLRTPAILAAFNKWDHTSWCISAAGDSLVRIRLFTEQNFHILETIGVVAVARYLFELGVWLRLFGLDRRYGLVYFDQLLETRQRYYQDTKAHLEREIALLRSFDEKEKALHERAMDDVKTSVIAAGGKTDAEAVASRLNRVIDTVSDAIDAEAARRFSIYAAGARTNGYGYQAHLVERQALPPILRAVADVRAERDAFEATVPPDVKELRPKRWQWRSMAEKVGAVDEYDYIYSFASKLLHATPASITTDQKNLETPEMEMFLKYIDVTICDIVTMAEEFCPVQRLTRKWSRRF